MRHESDRQGLLRFGADAEVGVGFGEEDLAVFRDDVSGGDGQTPAWLTVDEGDVDKDGAVVVLVVLGDCVDEAEFFGDGVAGVVEYWEGEAVLAGHEVALAGDLGADGDQEAFTLAEGAVEVAPGF